MGPDGAADWDPTRGDKTYGHAFGQSGHCIADLTLSVSVQERLQPPSGSSDLGNAPVLEMGI